MGHGGSTTGTARAPEGSDGRRDALPLPGTAAHASAPRGWGSSKRRARRVLAVLMVPLLIGTGCVAGLYFQPPGVRAFFALTGLEPGGGTEAPIARPLPPAEPAAETETVVALGRLLPAGDVLEVAVPFGAGDARVAELLVEEGEAVAAGDALALLDSLPQLEAARDRAEAEVAVREAALAQARRTTMADLREAEARRERARAGLALAEAEVARARSLAARNVVSDAALDEAEAAVRQAAEDLLSAEATVARYAGADDGTHPDIVRAERDLSAARADLARATRDLSQATVRAPAAGTVLDIHARPGEKPGSEGILTLGDIDRMEAELEVYQTDVRHVRPGQRVTITADALGDAVLSGRVARIGLSVERQSLVAEDPAANTDARVVKVTVPLDAPSARIARGYTGLQVLGRIAVGDGDPPAEQVVSYENGEAPQEDGR